MFPFSLQVPKKPDRTSKLKGPVPVLLGPLNLSLLAPYSEKAYLGKLELDMVDNAPFLTHQHGGLTIEGYSRAAVQTYWRIPELKIGFDLGAHPWDFMGTPTWLITHTHLDHVAALPVYVARRRMMRMEPPTLYLPGEALEDVRRLLLIMQRLDRGRMICTLNGLLPGEEIELSRELVITVFPTAHTIPSLGYVVWDRRFKLKEEYHGLPGDRIRDLRL